MPFPSDPEAILQQLAFCPAAAFHEDAVSRWIPAFLMEREIPFEQDAYGNIIGRYQRGPGAPAIAAVAHMDHPAFEIVEDGVAQLLGGIAPEYFEYRPRVRIFTSTGTVSGVVTGYQRPEGGGRLLLDLEVDGNAGPGDWGIWEMEDWREDGDYLYLRASDDLGGCAVALATLATLQEQAVDADFRAVFTRAEEVGLIGATLVAQAGLLPAGTVIVSLESSKVLPGVEQGAGPVIRVGDLHRTFDAPAEALLYAGRDALRRTDPEFNVQRHLMSGGTCEATAFGHQGYSVTGIALPLGNYHNQGPDSRLAPEYIHRADLAGAAALMLATVKAAPEADRTPGKAGLERAAEAFRERLRQTAPANPP